MPDFLLRIEAMNFAGFLEDTSDVSTIRGGGLLLLNAPTVVTGIAGLTPIYAGASTALFRFTACDAATAETVRGQVEERLHKGRRAAATIMVDVTPLENEEAFCAARNRLVALNRWRQLQTPSLVYPELNDTGAIDQLDDKRPGFQSAMTGPRDKDEEKGQPMILSAATLARREHGIEQKFHFYDSKKWDGVPEWREFSFHPGPYVTNLNEMADYSDASPGDLDGKLAYIYLDGNKFGTAARACGTAEQAKAWSACVRANQDSFLNWLLRVQTGEGAQTPWHWSGDSEVNTGGEIWKDRAFRIETLLWGGDEIIWVVPAWCGWWMLGSFFAHYGKLPWREGAPAPRTHFTAGKTFKLSHGAGIVFCKAKSPIQRVLKLAKHLADRPKALGTAGPSPDAYTDHFAYQVLESFDHLGTDADTRRTNQLPACLRTLTPDPLVLAGADMLRILGPMEQFRRWFPRSKIHHYVHEFQNKTGKELKSACEAAKEELERNGASNAFRELALSFGGSFDDLELREVATWLHIAELWDYTPVTAWTAPLIPGAPKEEN